MSGYEWRACASDDGDLVCDWEGPFDTRKEAEEVMERVRKFTEPPFDNGWIERRRKAEWERV